MKCRFCETDFTPQHPSTRYCSPDCIRQASNARRRVGPGRKPKVKPLRKCKCGVAAYTVDDLALFLPHKGYKHGYENKCLTCHREYKKTHMRKLRAKKPKYIQCNICEPPGSGLMNIYGYPDKPQGRRVQCCACEGAGKTLLGVKI